MREITIGQSIRQNTLSIYKTSDYKNKPLPKIDKYLDICLNCTIPANKCGGGCKKVNYGRF